MTLTVVLPEEQLAALREKAMAQGVPVEEYARQVLDRDLKTGGPEGRHISEVFTEIMSDVPREVFERLPSDGASEHDHYLYGSPKGNQ